MPFAGILGQDSSIAVLSRSLATGKIAHAYLFEGIEGCGKKMAALALVEAVFCGSGEGCGTCPSCRRLAALQHPDLHLVEPDGAFIKIDQIRDLQKELALRPFEAPKKACIVEAADRLNPAAGNALLKTLEEPPGNALLILLTANSGGVLPTILSRCQRLQFSALPQQTIEALLRDRGSEPETARIVASLAGGSMQKALEIGEEAALPERRSFLEKICSLSLSDIGPLFVLAEELAGDKDSASGMLELLTAFLRDTLLLQGGSGEVVNTDLLPLLTAHADRFAMDAVMGQLDHVAEARRALKANVNPRLALEVLFMRLAGQ
jgi:DNA polymerase-3 subunit delta'